MPVASSDKSNELSAATCFSEINCPDKLKIEIFSSVRLVSV